MSEDQELLARIGQLAGHINLHKAQPSSSQTHSLSQTSHGASEIYFARGVGSPRPRPAFHRTYQARGRAYPRNHSLVLNNQNAQSSAAHSSSSPATTRGMDPLQPAAAYVTKRGRHKQLINASVLDRVTLQRKQAIDDSQQRKLLATDQWERQRMHQYVETLEALPTSRGGTHKIEIDGLKFQILKGGSKLARIPGQHLFRPKNHPCSSTADTSDAMRPTPKRAIVHGVPFVRSKQGNLYRSGIIRASGRFRHGKLADLYQWLGESKKDRVMQKIHQDWYPHFPTFNMPSYRPCGPVSSSKSTLEANESDLSSDDDDRPGMDGEDIDSDDLDDEFIEGVDDSGRQTLAEQNDFVGF
ncbi:MAG: hypothetical protein Q9212_001004 [Teloschistes hypoglaucus]